MAANRHTPTLTSDPGGLADTAYATDVDDEIFALWQNTYLYVAGVAGSTTITGTVTPTLTAYATGMGFVLVPVTTNATTPVTLNVDTIGAKTIKDAAGNDVLARGLVAGQAYLLVYDGTNLRLLQPTDTNISCLTADFTGSNVSTAQPIFSSAQDAFTVEANTWYEFEAEYWITRAAGTTSHTTSVLFGGTATYTSCNYLAQVTNPTGNALANVQQIWAAVATAVVLTAANTSATENLLIKLKGRIRSSGAGTTIPQFQYSAAPGGAPTIKIGTTFKLRRMGIDTLATLGAWA